MGCRGKNLCQTSVLLAAFATASVEAAIIPRPELPNGRDSVRLPDGFQCSSAMAASSYIDAGVYQEQTTGRSGNHQDFDEIGGYVRILIPINSGNDRIDCNKLFEQALRERELNKALQELSENIFD